MGIRYNNREIESLYANGHNIIEAMINGRIVWPEEEYHWQPNVDMIWARSQWEALSGGQTGYLRMHYSTDLISDIFFDVGTVVTSDGSTYELNWDNVPADHIWDYSNSRQSEVYPEKKVVWTMFFPAESYVYLHELETGESYFCFDGIDFEWTSLIWTDIAYFDLLNGATPYFDSSLDAYPRGFFLGCEKLQAIPKEFNFKLSAYRIEAIFSGCYSLISVPYLDLENAYLGIGMFDSTSKLRELNLVNINVAIDLTPCPNLTKASLINVLHGLMDRTGQETLQIGFGATNLLKLTQSDLNIATIKNWEVVETVTEWPEWPEY
ncbi:hypothetical protein Q5O14_08565 [Eubacteriaceae bacterium ES2]|nr:hypothetical protein Q5O14_08565 [Eubacteriaceae bacterium ES2]